MGEQYLSSEVTSERAPKMKINLEEQRVGGAGPACFLPWPALGNLGLTFVTRAAGLPYRNSVKVILLHNPPGLVLNRGHQGKGLEVLNIMDH